MQLFYATKTNIMISIVSSKRESSEEMYFCNEASSCGEKSGIFCELFLDMT